MGLPEEGAATSLARPGVRERARGRDLAMAQARAELDWEGQFQAAINPAKARQIRHRRGVETDTCTMCSELCAIRLAKEARELEKGRK
ncbi:Phosphomethylpyrimidine synthase [uncultured archaeon]|nr:Phosphomethylpyrimidine synthase [uncultured archaeon]